MTMIMEEPRRAMKIVVMTAVLLIDVDIEKSDIDDVTEMETCCWRRAINDRPMTEIVIIDWQ